MPTHGSLTKAGKVRSQTPKVQARPRTSLFPRVKFRRVAEKRLVLGRKSGQNWMGNLSRGR
jgi:small subunit ribosomal protein S30e